MTFEEVLARKSGFKHMTIGEVVARKSGFKKTSGFHKRDSEFQKDPWGQFEICAKKHSRWIDPPPFWAKAWLKIGGSMRFPQGALDRCRNSSGTLRGTYGFLKDSLGTLRGSGGFLRLLWNLKGLFRDS